MNIIQSISFSFFSRYYWEADFYSIWSMILWRFEPANFDHANFRIRLE